MKMMKSKKGEYINMVSVKQEIFIYTPHYAASKFGVMGLTQSLAKSRNRKYKHKCNLPKIIDTDMWAYNDSKWEKF